MGKGWEKSREQRNIEKIVWKEKRTRSKAKQRKREREVSLIIPEIPGMNGSINSPRGGENYWMECSEYMS